MRRVAGRHFTRVRKAGLKRSCRLAVDDRDLVPGTGKIVGGGHANHATAENQYLHDSPSSNNGGLPVAAETRNGPGKANFRPRVSRRRRGSTPFHQYGRARRSAAATTRGRRWSYEARGRG